MPVSLYRDKIMLIQVAFGAVFFSTSAIWLTAIPRHIKSNLGHSELVVGLSALCFCFAAVISRPFVNRFGAKHNRHELMFVALMLMLCGGLLAMTSDSLTVVFISRFFTGVSDGLFYVGISTLIVANATKDKTGQALNIYTVSLYIGISLGPIIGEQLYHFDNSRVFFLAGAACAVLSLMLIASLRFVPSRFNEHISQTKKHAAFCRPALFPGLIFLLGISTWVGFEQFATLFGKSVGVHNVSALFAVIGVAVITIRLATSTVIDRMPIHLTIGIALGNAFVATMFFVLVHDPLALYVGAVFLAISLGFFYPGFVLAAMRRGEGYDSGTVLGTLSMFFDLAFGILPPILGLVAARNGYSTMFSIAAGMIGLAIVCTIFLRAPPPSSDVDDAPAHSDLVI